MAPLARSRPALFLDRDGVIIRDTGYPFDPATVALVPGITEVIKAANSANVPVLVVTNQSGIDRGLLGWNDFSAVEAGIADLLATAGVATGATAACPFHPNHTAGYDELHAQWRKPSPGMITALADRLNIDLPGSWLIGDQLRDLEAARNAGLVGGILATDQARPDGAPALGELARDGFVPHEVRSADEAVEILEATTLFNGV